MKAIAMSARKPWLAGLMVMLLFALPAAATAATYTCVDAQGRKSFSDRPCPGDSRVNARRDVSAAGVMSVRHGHTFAVQTPAGDASVTASCTAAPAPTDRPREGGCDRQNGDTACQRTLAVLCFKEPERRKGTALSGSAAQPDQKPAQPLLGASAAVRGDSLLSMQTGTQACVAALGAGWRMASIRDGSAGTLRANGHASLDKVVGRYWVATEGETGNCWNAPPQDSSATARTTPLPVGAGDITSGADLKKLRASPEFANLPPACRQGLDKLERSLSGGQGDGAMLNEASLSTLTALLEQCGIAAPGQR